MSTSLLLQEGFIRFRTRDTRLRMKEGINLALERGFTILEILFAIVILSIALIPLMKMLPEALILDAQMERETKVVFLAQRKMEEVKNKAIYDFSQDYAESATAFPSPDSTFKYTVSDDQGTGIKEITVNVWYDKNGNGSVDMDEEDIELNTKVAERN